MPRKSSKGKSRSRRKSSSSSAVIKGYGQASDSLSSAKIFYEGPIEVPRQQLQEHIIVTTQFFTGGLASSAGGIISSVFTNDPSNTLEWASISAIYDEFRVLGFDLEFFPSNRYSKTTTVCTPGVGVVDHGTIAVLASLAAGFQHESCRVLSLEDPWTSRGDFAGDCAKPLQWRMASSEEAVFTYTSTTLSNSAIKLYFTGLTASTTYGQFLLRFLVQFRGRA